MYCAFRMSRFPLSLLSATLTLATAQAVAATPDAGQILQEPRAPLVAPSGDAPALIIDKLSSGSVPEGGPRIRLTAIRFSGNTAFSADALQSLLADALGKELTFAELSRLVERVSRHYREAGYLVARAYLPAQEVKNGVLEMAMLEGNLGQVTITNTAGLKASALAPVHALPLNAPVQERSLDRALLTLSDLPGTRVQSTLRPGSTLGASDLLVEVQKTRSVQGSADIDNFGSTYTGEYRAGTSLYWNNPLDRGDQLSLRLQTSDADMHYERLGYQLPVGNYGTRVGAAVSHIDYRLGKDFESLDAEGRANTASLYLLQPLLRSPLNNWYGQLQLDAKSLRDVVDSTDTTTEQRLRNVVLGVNGDWQDRLLGGGSNGLEMNLTAGHVRLDEESQLQDAASAQSAGGFSKLNYRIQRVQFLLPDWSLALSLSGQVANKNLASVEKFSLGGSAGVRAYDQGEGLGDEGWLSTVALRWQPAPHWQLQAFYDAGAVKINHRPWATDSNRIHLGGAGLGLGWSTDTLAFSLTSAWATEGKNTADQHGARLWAQASIGF